MYNHFRFGSLYLYEAEHASPSEKEESVIRLATSKLLGSPELRYSQTLERQQRFALLGSLLPLSLSLQERPVEQVRHHLAILDQQHSHVEAMCVIRPSEPVLAIAAGRRLYIGEEALMCHLLVIAAMLEMPRSERCEMLAMLLLIATQHRSSLLNSTPISNALHRVFPYRASDLAKPVSLADYLERLLVLTDNERLKISRLGSAGRVRVCQFIRREQNSLPDSEDLSAAYARGCAFACCVDQRSCILIVPLVFGNQEPGALMVEVKARGDFESSLEQEAMSKLRDSRAKMFTEANKPRCVLILLNLAVSVAERTTTNPLDISVSQDDPSVLQLVVNGPGSLSILNRIGSAGETLPCNIGDSGPLESLLDRGEVTSAMTEHQQTVRETMNPLCGAAPGHRQFWDSQKAERPKEASTSVFGSKKRKGSSCLDE